MPNMELIQAVTVGAGGATSIEFTNIPQTYTDLVLKLSARSSSSDAILKITYNANTSNYSRRGLQGNGASASSNSANDAWIGQITPSTYTADTFASTEIYIPNYTSSNNKSFSIDNVQENNSSTSFSNLLANLWSNTSAITSIKLEGRDGTVTLVQYTTAYLYGVSSAAVGAKATGGIIASDANYFYHTFLASGTFTPTANITADYLVVAGGGAGGVANFNGNATSGGGGAGGLRSTVTATGGGGSLESALSLTSGTGYTVTIGAGGAGSSAEGTDSTNGSNSVFSSITSTGGGFGSTRQPGGSNNAPSSGGSGGGGGNAQNGAAGTTNQGYAGGNPTNTNNSGAGGGGAGGIGGDSGSNVAGVAGLGLAVAITGSSVTYATGGRGRQINPVDGTANLGNGGDGGSTSSGTPTRGGNGGSGIVIVRYAR